MSEDRKSSKYIDKSSDPDSHDAGPNTLENAAHEAALADGLIQSENGDAKSKKASLRRGKWTTEEEAYANRLIYEFKLGLLPLTDGTTLRTFLSKLLNCDPMRISKKFVGQNCIGKQVFRRRQQDLEKLSGEQIEQSRRELADLERKFLERVAQTNRTKTGGTVRVKDGRLGYEEESGAPILAPWMIPPNTEGGGSAPGGSADANRNGSNNPQGPLFPSSAYNHYPPPGYPASGEVPPMDYHQMVSMMSMYAPPCPPGSNPHALPPYPYYPFYPPFPSMDAASSAGGNSGAAGGAQGPMSFSSSLDNLLGMGMPSAQSMNNIYKNMYPWAIPGATAPGPMGSTGGVGGGNNSMGEGMGGRLGSVEWASLSNLIGAGESMENMSMFQRGADGAGNAGNSGVGTANAGGGEGDGKSKPEKDTHGRKHRLSDADNVGFPLDESGGLPSPPFPAQAHPASAISVLKHHEHAASSHGEGRKNSPDSNSGANGSGGAGNDRYSFPPPYATPQFSESKKSDGVVPILDLSSISKGETKNTPYPPIPVYHQSALPQGTNNPQPMPSSAMPRNSSVENFWMLVDMGEIPRPDHDVLSESIFLAAASAKDKVVGVATPA
eukprot:gene34954-42330_t